MRYTTDSGEKHKQGTGMSPSRFGITSLAVRETITPTTAQINQFLGAGRHRLVVVAPFGNHVVLTPLNPVPGFQFLPDGDSSVEVWNSLVITPQDGQFAFLARLSKPLGDEVLQILFIAEAAGGPAPPPAVSLPPPVPPPAPPPAPPLGDMQDFYRQRGHRIAGDGAVEFYYAAIRTHQQTGRRQLCLVGNFAWGNPHLHDPRRAMAMQPNESGYAYSRLGPYPNRGEAEAICVGMATSLFGDPTQFGMMGTGGIQEIIGMRMPAFR